MQNNIAIISNHKPQTTNHKPQLCPLISVIIPVYNTEKFLNRCVKSVLAQTYTNLEVILVDDGSPDNCPAICDEWARKDERVRVIHTPNRGTGAARNSGLGSAHGELIAFADSDDYLYPNMYQRLYELMTENDADLSVCEYTRVDEEGNRIPDLSKRLPDCVMTGEEALNFSILPVKNYSWHVVLPWNKLYKAEIFTTLRFPELRKPSGGEDTAIIHRVFGAARKIIISDEELYYYVQRERVLPVFDRSLFRLSVFMVRDRYEYFTETGRAYLAEMTAINAYGILVNTMRTVNYLQFREELGQFMRGTLKRLVLSFRIPLELRAVKLVFVCLRSIFRPFLSKGEYV